MRTVEVQWLYETTTRYGTWSPRISVRIEVQEDLQLVAGSGLVNQAGDELLDFVALKQLMIPIICMILSVPVVEWKKN